MIMALENLTVLLAQAFEIFPTAIYLLIIIVVAMLVYKIVAMALRSAVLKRAKTKEQRNNAMVLISLWRYSFAAILILGIIFFLGGDLTGLGIWAGLLSAALGWALQKPITGVAGWIMAITKKPFQIGDRIQIGGVKGDVLDINPTHIHLREIGGTINTEETSGRVVMIPNSKLFEQDIVNYTMTDDYILEQVVTAITYESNLDKAIDICMKAANKVASPYLKHMPHPPYLRTFFQQSGIDVKTRFYVPASERIRLASDLTKEIFSGIRKAKDVEIAYPHTEVVLRNKKPKK
jgi:small-conductance mechanosensitive channel